MRLLLSRESESEAVAWRAPPCQPERQATVARGRSPMRGCSPSALLRNRQCLLDDSLLLGGVGGGIALTGARSVRAADVPELHAIRHELAFSGAGEHEAPGA